MAAIAGGAMMRRSASGGCSSLEIALALGGYSDGGDDEAGGAVVGTSGSERGE